MRVSLVTVAALVIYITACARDDSRIFSGRPATWDAKARKLSLEDRYGAFRYGVTKIMPPVILAEPMADGGRNAVILIQRENAHKPNDRVLIASLHVYDSMKMRRIWDLCANSAELSTARKQRLLVANSLVRQRYDSYLSSICR